MAPREQDSIPTEAIGTPSFKIFGKAMEIPIVNDAIQVATNLHTEAVTYPYVNQVETIIGGFFTKAEDTITPHVSSTMTSTVTSTATKLDTLACTGLDQVTGKVPALKLPTGELATATTDATLNLANTIQDYVAKLTVVRLLLTAFGMVLGFSIKGLETVLGLLEDKAEMNPATITSVAGVVKPVLAHINTFKLLLEEIVKRSKPIDVTKPVEELREESNEVEEELREESNEVEELREESHEVEEELREETHEVEEELREETHEVEEELREVTHEEEELREDSHEVEEELGEDSEEEL